MVKKKFKNIFPKKKSIGKRDWGKEDLLVLIPKLLSLKLLFIKKGRKGSLQYHHKKNECGHLIEGKLKIKYDDGAGILKQKILSKGSSFHFPPGLVHQEIALSDCKILEASSPHFNDRVRVEKKYGFKIQHGLPSTKRRDVKIK
ncbi:cupin domain-containing protein [Candidatus Pelagibacter sp.]|nr:cupin domain-containing protein [Candidatus Pelagibacter sp.]